MAQESLIDAYEVQTNRNLQILKGDIQDHEMHDEKAKHLDTLCSYVEDALNQNEADLKDFNYFIENKMFADTTPSAVIENNKIIANLKESTNYLYRKSASVKSDSQTLQNCISYGAPISFRQASE
jgi:hypothetical protein